jgi:predicted permease
MSTLIQDVRYGLRMLRKSPGFTAIAALTLALGIGANTVVFSVLNTLFFRPAPVCNPNELVVSGENRRGISPAEYFFDREHNNSFSSVAAQYVTAHTYMVSEGETKMVLGAIVSANYFEVLGIKPFLGRYFVPDEDAPTGRTPVAVLSYGLWRSDFAADRDVLGKTIKLNSVATTIVGVAPPEFHGLHAGIDNDLWIPTAGAAVVARGCERELSRCGFFDGLVGRLRPGHSLVSAQAELNALNKQWEGIYPDLRKTGIVLSPARGLYPGRGARREVAQAASLLPASVIILLLIACANLAGLLLARGTARAKEIAVRLALGASRARIIRQLLTEAALLAVLGSLLGLLLLQGSEGWLSRFPFIGSEGFKSYYDVSLNSAVLASTLALSVMTVFVFGLAPAVRASAPAPIQTLKNMESTASPRSRLRGMLVGGQVALAFILAAGALLLVQSLDHVLMGPGFDPSHIAIVRVSPYRLGYTPAESEKIQREALRRVASLPGVRSASFGRLMPWWESSDKWIALPGHEPAREEAQVRAHYNDIAPNFLKTVQIPLLRGREFTDGDRQGVPRVVVVNESLAARMWPVQDPLGQTLVIGGVNHTVVGVARDAQYNPASDGAHLFFYLPYWQVRDGGDARFLVRTGPEPGAMLSQIKGAIHAINPEVPIGEDTTMREGLLSDFGPLRLTRVVLIFAGTAGFFLSAIGLYGVLAFVVARRTREIGIRMALGATRQGVLALFLRQGMLLALAGALTGSLGALATTRLLAAMLYGVSPREPALVATVGFLLVVVCFFASYLPARRATRVDPMVALRYE